MAAAILTELVRTLGDPYFIARISPHDVAQTLALLAQSPVAITRPVSGVATHPEDDEVLATALSAGAPYLVAGDARFIGRVPRYQTVQLVTPREFRVIPDALPRPAT